MAEKLHDLKQNKMTFEARGLVTGTKSQKFYRSGTTKSGNAFNEINFGLTIAPQKTIYVKLTGFVQESVYYYGKANKDDKKGQSIKVAWKDRKKSPAENFRLIGVNISVDRDGDNNVNEVMVPYDAVEYLHKSLKDGESYFVRGEVKPSSFTNNEGNVIRKVELILNQMSYTNSPVDFDAEDFEPKADIIVDPFVFASINKETDEDDKPTGRYILQGYDIGYNSIELMNFIVEASDEGLAKKLKKRMKPGYSMKMFGEISVVHDIVEEEEDDDDWGVQRKSKKNVVKSRSRFEYVLFDVDGKTFDAEEYSEDGIAKAMKAIKNAKTAEAKFADKDEEENEQEWGFDEDDDDSDPWD